MHFARIYKLLNGSKFRQGKTRVIIRRYQVNILHIDSIFILFCFLVKFVGYAINE